jgi:aspartate ammonia-lyase
VFVEKSIRGIEADRKRSEGYYISSPSLATALNPIIGYARAAELAKESAKSGTPIPQLLREKKVLSEAEIARIFTPEFLAGQADRPAPQTTGERRAASGERKRKK